MRSTNLKRLVVFLAVIGVSMTFVKPTQADLNLFSVLKGFFQKTLRPIQIHEGLISSPKVTADLTRWNERVKIRDAWKLNPYLIDIFHADVNTGAINISSGDPGLDPTAPDIAYDTTMNRYLVVWEEETEANVFNIMGQFRDRDGATIGSPVQISTTRNTQGCFYTNFDTDNGAINVAGLERCQNAANPSVAYNNGRYLVAWELRGTALDEQGRNSDGSDNPEGRNFVNIIAKIVNANDLNSAVSPDWAEGIIISRVWIASNVSTPAANDSQIQAWAKSTNPDVAPVLGSGQNGFLVTWQSDRDYIGCVSANRRGASSVFGRYIDQNFSSAGGSSNKPLFTIYTNPASGFDANGIPTSPCSTLDNVFSGQNPRIAFNSNRNDFVVAFEHVRAASATTGDIGAKRVSLDGEHNATVNNSMMPTVVGNAPEGTTFRNPDLASFGDDVILAYDNGSQVLLQKLRTSSSEVATVGSATTLDLGGSGAQTEPRIAGNVGIGGNRTEGDPQRVVVAYTQGGVMKAAVVDNNLAITKTPVTISGASTMNHIAEAASDLKDFFIVWAGTAGGLEQVWGAKVAFQDVPPPNCTWDAGNPSTPPDMPTSATQWAPTRLFMDWNDCTPTVTGDTIRYDVYFSTGGTSGAIPYKSGVIPSSFVIQASTDNRTQYNPDGGVTPIFLAPSTVYKWKICARNSSSSGPAEGPNCMPADRTFRTDDSVVGWWRFDENPAGPVCAGGGAGESVCDYSGKNNHGVPSGGPVWLPPPDPMILGGALDFDGANDFVSVVNDSSLNIPGSISVMALIKPEGLMSSQNQIIGRDSAANNDGGNYNIVLNPVTGSIDFTFFHGIGGELNRDYRATGTSLTTGNRRLLTLRHTFGMGGTTEMRINNAPQVGSWVTGTGNELPITVNNFFSVGSGSADLGGLRFFNGVIEEVLIYNKYLNATELDNGFNSQL